MAPHVLPGGKVLAEDIQPEMLDVIRQRVKEKSVPNVEPVLGTPTDPKLPPSSVDMILLVDVYHEFSEPWEMTVNMVKTLKPGGRLVFVEYRKENRAIPIKEVHKMTEAQVKAEMAPHPLKWLYTSEILPRQHIIVFEKVKPKALRRSSSRTSPPRNR
jgi:ubiquinone/menaquinone biosynthesis C-methylase UbiE